jgi:MerR family mercuric resistance operon transcriptional regulator
MATTTRPSRRGIGALSARSGCHVETIRYYEQIGLLPPAPRSEGGHRRYGEAEARRLGFIRRARELGFALGAVRTPPRLVDGGRYGCAQVKGITLHHLDDVAGRSPTSARSSGSWPTWPGSAPGGGCPAAP